MKGIAMKHGCWSYGRERDGEEEIVHREKEENDD